MTLKEISTRIKVYDDQLRVIRSRRMYEMTHQFRVERHVQSEIIVSQKPSTLPDEQWWEIQDPDDRLSAQEDNCLLLFTFWPNQMDNRIYYTLSMLDTYHMDSRVTDQENRIKARKHRGNLAFGDMVGQEAKEWYRYINTVRTVSEKHCHTAPEGGMSIMGGL